MVNNMASVYAGTNTVSGAYPRQKRSAQQPPDIDRAKRLAQAAARLVEIVEPDKITFNPESSHQPLGDSECALARVVIAFNLGVLSEVCVMPLFTTVVRPN